MPRIAVAGFLHESNSFAAGTTPRAAFERPGGWPMACAGADLVPGLRGTAVPGAGAIAALEAAGARIVPLSWCMANPSGVIEDAAFETIAGDIVGRLRAAMPVDGVYLDLHGAAVCETIEDPEGELLARVRAAVGPSVPITASLDFHANVTELMVEASDALAAFRTYPHIDMIETGARAVELLLDMVRKGARPAKALAKPPVLISIVWQATEIEPMRSLMAEMVRLEAAHGVSMSLLAGFPLADIAACGPAIVAYGERADEAVARLSAAFDAAMPAFGGALYAPGDIVPLARATPGRGPLVVADTQDNPGGGGFGDTTGLLAALVAAGATNACVCMIVDADSARAAHAAGQGAAIDLALGGKSDGVPFHARFLIERLSDGRFVGAGPMTTGNRVDLGPSAVLVIGGVRVVVVSRKMQAHDPAIMTHLGLDPVSFDILVLKSSVHFRAAFARLARAVIVAVAPGPVTADIATLTFMKLRPGVALSPGGPVQGGAVLACQ